MFSAWMCNLIFTGISMTLALAGESWPPAFGWSRWGLSPWTRLRTRTRKVTRFLKNFSKPQILPKIVGFTLLFAAFRIVIPRTRSAQRSACALSRQLAPQGLQEREKRAGRPLARRPARARHRAAGYPPDRRSAAKRASARGARPGASRPTRGGSAAYGGSGSPEAARP